MIQLVRGNLLEADAEALVNTVNTVGIMGKGIALQFKQAFPENFRAYEAASHRQEIELGRMFVFDLNRLENPRFIINFPTKRHWRGKSRLQDIQAGLKDLVEVVRRFHIRSIAVPPLGCGNGGLDWKDVRPEIENVLGALSDIRILLFEPAGAPAPEQMKIGTSRPRLTPARAAVLALMYRYALPGYELTMLEIQKLAYFLQISGEPLKLKFEKGKFGPYAEQLHFVLQRLEGHYITGYGDRSRDVAVTLLEGAGEEAENRLAEECVTQERFARVSALIDGFETPHGMELLATVHWVAGHEDAAAVSSPDHAVTAVHAWSEHKQRAFRPEHIKTAWQRLHDQGWL